MSSVVFSKFQLELAAMPVCYFVLKT